MYCAVDEVKRAMGWPDSDTSHDVLLEEIVEDVTSRIDSIAPGDTLNEMSYTEHHDGGVDNIVLRRRPLVSVTSIHDDLSHEFDSGTLVAASDYIAGRSELAIVRLKIGTFIYGRGNVQVIYVAGYSTIPSFVRDLARRMAVRRLKRRENPEMTSTSVGDVKISFMTEAQEEREMRIALAPIM